MKIIKVTESHLDACMQIARKQYLKECESVSVLYEEHYEQELFQRLKSPCKKGYGIVCIEENQVCGYLLTDCDIEKNANHYIAIQVWGYGAEYRKRSKIISFMFQHFAMKVMNLNNTVQFNVKIYAHDSEIKSYFTFCQFGIMCTEAIRNTSTRIYPKNEVMCKELSNAEILDRKSEILKLYRLLVEHLRQSPVFYPGKEFTDDIYINYILSDTTRMFAAYSGNRIIGIIDAAIDNECFLMNHKRIYNVGDIYVEEGYRGKLVSQALLMFVNDTLQEENVEKLWVEHGTANPNATGFWDKYFENYTYTLAREIKSTVF
jgi:GNAT superfamily N-acetyltransferase